MVEYGMSKLNLSVEEASTWAETVPPPPKICNNNNNNSNSSSNNKSARRLDYQNLHHNL